MVNGITHYHDHKSTEKPVTFQILDYMLCFDSMWFEEVTKYIFEAGVNDDILALIAKINQSNDIAI